MINQRYLNLILYSMILFVFCSCGRNYYDDNEEYQENMERMRKRQAKEFEIETRINFETGKQVYFLKQFEESRRYFEKCEQWKFYKDSIIQFYNKNLDFAIQSGQYIWAKDIAKIYGIQN